MDLRSVCVCSVDPPGCTDIDDALHARPRAAAGTYEVGVHIADVTHFVRPDTPLDKEAASRSTTVYLVDKRIDMVPGSDVFNCFFFIIYLFYFIPPKHAQKSRWYSCKDLKTFFLKIVTI